MPIVFENILMPNASGGPNILTSVLPNGVQGTFYTFTMTASGGTLPYVWSLAGGTLDSGVTLSAAGILSGTPANAETDNIVIRVTDAHGLFITKAFSVTFTPIVNPLVINTTSPLPSGNEFNTYSTTLNASGGTPGYTWSIITGAFQTGITLNSATGVISGTPTQAGTDTVTIQVQDSVAATTSKVFSLTIAAPAPLTITTTSPLPSGTDGFPYSTTLNATGGITPYIWSILTGSLQAGLSLSSGGTISGTPSVISTVTVTIQVQDNVGTDASKTFNLTTNAQGTVATPTFSPVAGNYSSSQSVTLTCTTPTSNIYYTIDGSTPTFPITGTTVLYTSPISVSASETIKAIGVANAFINSAVGSATYTLTVSTPTFSPLAGSYPTTQTVTLSCATPSSSIYFTLDSTTPTFPITGTTTLYTGPLTVSTTETIKAIGVVSGWTNSSVGTAAYAIGAVTTTVPNLAALSATFPGPDNAGFAALNMLSKAAGFAWNDTVTGARVTKITSTTVPSPGGSWGPWYSSMGLSISLPWGTNSDQYTVGFIGVPTSDTLWLCDFGLQASATPGPYNYRAGPSVSSASGGQQAFSRLAGNPHIMYALVSGHLRLYNTATNSFLDATAGAAAAAGYSASWPVGGWPWSSSVNWLMVNAQETWATGNTGSASPVLVINLLTGATQSIAPGGVDDTYVGYGEPASDPCFSGDGSPTASYSYDLATNTRIATTPAITGANWDGSLTFHMPTLRNRWVSFGSNKGSGSMQMLSIFGDGTNNANSNVLWPKYYGQFHNSGHWWTQGTGTQYLVMSTDDADTDASWSQSEKFAITFIDPDTGASRRLGFHYSWSRNTGSGNMVAGGPSGFPGPGGASAYYSQSHTTISHDGKLVMFGSNMINQAQIQTFIMEVPLTAGVAPSFP